MKKLLCLIGGAMFMMNAYAQNKKTIEPYFVGDILPNISLGEFINFKDSSAQLNTFKGRLVILDFWNTRCGSCIEKMPKMAALQNRYRRDIQIIMVTYEPKSKIVNFIRKWESKHATTWKIPIVINDSVLKKYFPHKYASSYLWIGPERKVVAKTTTFLINKKILKEYIKRMPEEIKNVGMPIN